VSLLPWPSNPKNHAEFLEPMGAPTGLRDFTTAASVYEEIGVAAPNDAVELIISELARADEKDTA
jgi:hypothetical protein